VTAGNDGAVHWTSDPAAEATASGVSTAGSQRASCDAVIFSTVKPVGLTLQQPREHGLTGVEFESGRSADLEQQLLACEAWWAGASLCTP
jgi:hypothetical protein